MQRATIKLDSRVVDVAKLVVIDALETCTVEHIKAFIKSALRTALNESFISIIDNSTKTQESFNVAVAQTSPASSAFATIAAAMVKKPAVMASISMLITERVRKSISKSTKSLGFSPPTPIPHGLDSPFDKSQKNYNNKERKKRNSMCTSVQGHRRKTRGHWKH